MDLEIYVLVMVACGTSLFTINFLLNTFWKLKLNIMGTSFLQVLPCWRARKMMTSVHRAYPEKAHHLPKVT